MDNQEKPTLLGVTNFRDKKVKFGIKKDDRRRHFYIIGKTGGGKTTMLENMIVSDIQAGNGVGVIDPHGDFAEKLLKYVPESRIDDVIYFNPADENFPFAFNPLERTGQEHRHLVASGLMSVFKKIWPDVWSARMEYILNNAILTLLEYPGSTLLGIMRILSDKEYRARAVSKLTDPVIRNFWVNEFSRYTQRLETEATAAIQNKVGQFISNPLIRNIVGQPKSTLNFREIMDNKKIFIANLSKGRIGDDNSALLGAMMVTKIQLAAMSRVDIPETEREDFYLYIDEFQNFSTDSFASILSEARKYRLDLILAHQYIKQLIQGDSMKVRDAIFGNVGTIVSFRIGAEDAEFLEKEFEPHFTAQDLVNLGKFNVYIKLMVDGIVSKPFSAETLPNPDFPEKYFTEEIIENNRKKYGTPREVVDQKTSAEVTNATNDIDIKAERRAEQPLRILKQRKEGMDRPKRIINLEQLRGALNESLKFNKKAGDEEKNPHDGPDNTSSQ